MTPLLTIVATARNDNHGGKLLHRMQLFINGILSLSEKYKLAAEIILVDWNPPADKPGLAQALEWPKSHAYCTVRVIKVPQEIHNKYELSSRLPLYQMIGKNVGIRRARGEFVLVTNVDILFSEEIFEWFTLGHLTEGCIYRVDRTDVVHGMTLDMTIEEQLRFCGENIVRINTRYGTRNLRTGDYYAIVDLKDVASESNSNGPVILHTNGCGDFQLMSKNDWFRLRGYPELDLFSMHIDSILAFMAQAAGIKEVTLEDPCRIYHIEHDAGWSPESERNKTLETRLLSNHITSLSYMQLYIMAADMLRSKKAWLFNSENWGLQAVPLQEVCPVIAESDEYAPPLTNHENGLEYRPVDTCNTRKCLKHIEDIMLHVLSFGSGNVENWIKNLTRGKSGDIGQKRIIVFGASKSFQDYVWPTIKYLGGTINYLVDNNPNLQGGQIEGIPVLSPENLAREDKNQIYIIVASMYYDQIRKQLLDMGYSEYLHFTWGKGIPSLEDLYFS